MKENRQEAAAIDDNHHHLQENLGGNQRVPTENGVEMLAAGNATENVEIMTHGNILTIQEPGTDLRHRENVLHLHGINLKDVVNVHDHRVTDKVAEMSRQDEDPSTEEMIEIPVGSGQIVEPKEMPNVGIEIMKEDSHRRDVAHLKKDVLQIVDVLNAKEIEKGQFQRTETVADSQIKGH